MGRAAETVQGRAAETVQGKVSAAPCGEAWTHSPNGEAPHNTFIGSPALHAGASVPELPRLRKLYCAMGRESDRVWGLELYVGQRQAYNPGKW